MDFLHASPILGVPTDDGSALAMCPFGKESALAAAGAIEASTPIVDLELRQGGRVVAIGHVCESTKALDPSGVVGVLVAPPGSRMIESGVIRSVGVEIEIDDVEP